MTGDQAAKSIYVQWMTLWPGLSGSTPFVFDNDVIDESATYARVFVKNRMSEQYSLGAVGNRRWLRYGEIVVRLKGPANVGRKTMDQLVNAVIAVFEGQRLGSSGTDVGLMTYAASTSEAPPNPQFWQTQITIPFEYYEVR
jgi:hypothetical protein